MSDSVQHRCPTELGGILCRVFGLDEVAENPLLKKIYYAGLAVLGLWAVVAMLTSLVMAIDHPGSGAGGFFVVAAIVGFGTAGWRLGCEAVLLFLHLNPLRDPAPPTT